MILRAGRGPWGWATGLFCLGHPVRLRFAMILLAKSCIFAASLAPTREWLIWVSNGMIRILVVDDHPILREGIASLLEDQPDMLLVGEATDGLEAVEQFRLLRPDITLMDIQMPGAAGTQAIIAIRAEAPAARIIVLTTYAGEGQAARALRAGASGYLLKSSLRREMIEVIRSVHGGARHVDARLATKLAFPSDELALGDRESEVLRLIAVGNSNRAVAGQLGISEETVKTHLKSIFAKLRVSDRTHAVTEAIRRGILEI
jgi:DNA-binding NarL/FixJ family response regulator